MKYIVSLIRDSSIVERTKQLDGLINTNSKLFELHSFQDNPEDGFMIVILKGKQ